MPQLRKDPVLGRWVIIATERGKRPTDFATEPEERKGGFCPFDEGNEDKTPPEVMSYRAPGTAPDTPGWKVRVDPNLGTNVWPTGADLCPDVLYSRVTGKSIVGATTEEDGS